MSIRCTSMWTVLAVLCAGSAANAGRPAEKICAERITPACFEYVFTSIVTPSVERPTLALNHRGGRTYFVRVGDKVGEYTVSSFNSIREKVFDPTVNAGREVPSGDVTLKAADGRETVLKLGKPLPQPGWAARLVSLETGRTWDVAEKDIVNVSGARMTLVRIAEDAVTASADGEEFEIPMLSEEDKTKLALQREERVRQEEAARAKLAQQQEQARQVSIPASRPAPVYPYAVAQAADVQVAPRLPGTHVDFQYNGEPRFYYMPGVMAPYQPPPGSGLPIQWIVPPNAIIHHMEFPSVSMSFNVPSGAFASRGASVIQSRDSRR